MRVLFISNYCHPVYHRKIELLADTPGVDILHINGADCDRPAGRYPSANGRQIYRVQLRSFRSLGRPGDPHRIICWPPNFYLRQFKPDIIHCEFEQESLGALQVALARRLFAPDAQLILYAYQNILRPRNLPVRRLSATTLQAAQHIICASREAVDVLRRQGYAGQSSVLPGVGLDRRYFYPKSAAKIRAQLGLQGFVVGYVGRLAPEKSVGTLLNAVAGLKNITLLLIGNGPQKARLQALAQDLDIGHRCFFVGAIDYNMMADYMNAMDALVLPSSATPNWKEQFGRVLVEAMACKVVVAGSNSGAIPEVIGEAVFIVPPQDALALAKILGRVSTDATLHQLYAERGFQRATQHYSVERVAQEVATLWQNLPVE